MVLGLKFKLGLMILVLMLFLRKRTTSDSFRGPPSLTKLIGGVESIYHVLGTMLGVVSKR